MQLAVRPSPFLDGPVVRIGGLQTCGRTEMGSTLLTTLSPTAYIRRSIVGGYIVYVYIEKGSVADRFYSEA